MIERVKLNALVVMTLQNSEITLKASQLYNEIRTNNPQILREDKVKSFRSFVKIINSFDTIKQLGSGVRKYTIRK